MRAGRIRSIFLAAAAAFALGLSAAAAPALNGPPPNRPPPNPLANQKQAVLDHLNAELRWYREIQTGNQWVSQESDTFFFNNQRKLAADALRDAFKAAEAEVPLIAESTAPATGPASQQSQRLAAFLSSTEDRIQKLTAQRADLDGKVAAAQADGPVPPGLSEQRDVVIAQLQLAQAQADVLQKISSSNSETADDSVNLSLAGMIAALERSVPEIAEPVPGEDDNKAKPSGAATPAAPVVSTSIFGRASQLYTLGRSRGQLDDLMTKRTPALEAQVLKLREPLRASLGAIVQGGQQVNGQVSQATDPAQLVALRQQVEGWTTQYKELSGVLVPLSQETTLLTQSEANLTEWHKSLDRQYAFILRALLIKTITLAGTLVILLIVGEVWRRATFRYVADAQRRRQLLLIRRIVIGGLATLIVVIGFISDFGSLATFAGFITAGVAVALQSVILSVAAWFFLSGRYGVKVGDRVTISGVTGEVIDIGLVRIYLMEYAGTGVDLHPTGRVVVFANSALFSSNPLFKQIPGTEFTWHEIFMPVKPEADLADVKDKLSAVVARVYQDFRPTLEKQHSAVERIIDVRLDVPEPIPTMRFTGSGIEFVVRYPLELNRGAEVDSKMAHAVLLAIRADEKLIAAISGMPQIRSAVHS